MPFAPSFSNLFSSNFYPLFHILNLDLFLFKKVPDFSNNTLVELETFDEILDISEKLEKPILFIEMHKHQKSWFLVVNNNEIYKYVLKLVDVDKANFKKEK